MNESISAGEPSDERARAGLFERLAARLPDAGLVFFGGALGTLARFLLDAAIVAGAVGRAPLPVGILLINVLGAFLLGVLTERLAPGLNDRWRSTRLLLGTGVLGGFTTYSALAVGIAQPSLDGRPWLGAFYGALTLLLGGGASWLGVLVGVRRARPGAETGEE